MLYKLENIEYYYDSGFSLDIESLHINSGDIIGFCGSNGSGKSTLMKLLAFLEKPSKGSLYYNNHEVTSKNIEQIRQNTTMLFQSTTLLHRSVIDNITYGLKVRKVNINIDQRISEILPILGIEKSWLRRKWYELSGGEAKRIALASRLIMKPDVILLDEPTAEIDSESSFLIYNAIKKYNKDHKTTFIISSHDNAWLSKTSDKVIAIENGKIKGIVIDNQLGSSIEITKNNLIKILLSENQYVLAYPPNDSFSNEPHILPEDILIAKSKIDNISAQNCLSGKIVKLELISANKILVTTLIDNTTIYSYITENGAQKLNLSPGANIYLIFKINSVKWA